MNKLEIFFCNVGDGDATVIREMRDNQPDYVLMVDTGRPFLEYVTGSQKREALYHLKGFGIDHIDLLVLTHLHIDHIGGTENILRHMPVYRIVSGFFPPDDAQWVTPPYESKIKPVIGLACMMNIYKDLTDLMIESGSAIEEVSEGTVNLTENLSVEMLLPHKKDLEKQNNLYKLLYSGKYVEYNITYKASKGRNPLSLMVLIEYKNRKILITGDRYAETWENLNFGEVDILKLPHHGDPKSITADALAKLKPQYAIISCQNDPTQKKDRPNAEVLAYLQDHVQYVFCTENRQMPTMEAATYSSIQLVIDENGNISHYLN